MDYESELGRLAAMIAHAENPRTRERLREQMRVLRRAKRNLRGQPMPCAGGPSAEALVCDTEATYRCPECGAEHQDWARRCELCGALMGLDIEGGR